MLRKVMHFLNLILFVCLLILLTSCKAKVYKTDYFTYEIWNTNPHYKHIVITGLTDYGKTQEILSMPSEINGIPVTHIGAHKPFKGDYGSIQSVNLKKFYMNDSNIIGYYQGIFINCPNLEMIITNPKMEPPLNMSHNNPNYTIITSYYAKYSFSDIQLHRLTKDSSNLPANVVYMYNYKDAPNHGYYFIDDYDNKLIDFIPDKPTRKGYTFDGWYKEPECIHKWNFTEDYVPRKLYDKNGIYFFFETRLYAKWITTYSI